MSARIRSRRSMLSPPAATTAGNLLEGDECFESDSCSSAGVTGPVASYTHDEGCSITGGLVYRGSRLPALYGAYLFADYCSGTLWATAADSPGQIQIINAGLDNPASFGTDQSGEVYVVGQNGYIWKIVEP
jgi:hypothetical protein